MSKTGRVAVAVALLAGGAALGFLALTRGASLLHAATWQRQASPGPLSAAHRFLGDNCAACHGPDRRTDAANCTVCHANDASLLQRQPTAFHADVASCRECHPEHRGGPRPHTTMDHAALAGIGLRQLADKGGTGGAGALLRQQLVDRIGRHGIDEGGTAPHARISSLEATLNCAGCHANKDRHFKLFGQDCAACHATAQWTIPEYRHPSPRSTDCAQCHQAPPSHYMEHFRMVSAKVACQPNARVAQCYLCHQTTSWNDIKGVGWYKHH